MREHRRESTRRTEERDAAVSKASAALVMMEAARIRRADVASLRRRVEEIQKHTKALRDDNELGT